MKSEIGGAGFSVTDEGFGRHRAAEGGGHKDCGKAQR